MWRIGIWLVLSLSLSLAPVMAEEPVAESQEASDSDSSTVEAVAAGTFYAPTIPTRWWGLSPTEIRVLHAGTYPESATQVGDVLDPTMQRYECLACLDPMTMEYQFNNGELIAIIFNWSATATRKDELLRVMEATWRTSDSVDEHVVVEQAGRGSTGKLSTYSLRGASLMVTSELLEATGDWSISVYVNPEARLEVVSESNASQTNPNTTPLEADKYWPVPGPDFKSANPERYKKLRKSFVEEISKEKKFSWLHPKDVDTRQLRPFIVLAPEGMCLEILMYVELGDHINFDHVRFDLGPSGMIDWDIPVSERINRFHEGQAPIYHSYTVGGATGNIRTGGTASYFSERIVLSVQSGANKPGIDLGDLILLSQYEAPITMIFSGQGQQVVECKPNAFKPLHDTLELFALMGGELPHPLEPRTKPPETAAE